MVMARRMPRIADAVRVPHLRFRHIAIDFDRDDPRPRITADVEAPVDDMDTMHALYDAGAVDIGREAAIAVAESSYSAGLRLERSIDIAPPHFSSAPVLRGSGTVLTNDKEGRTVILVHVPYQRRPWRVTIELDHGRDLIKPFDPITQRQVGLAEMIIRNAKGGY